MNNMGNLVESQGQNALANFSAFGGPLELGSGAIGYEFGNEYLNNQKMSAIAKQRLTSLPNSFQALPDMNTHNAFAGGGWLGTGINEDVATAASFLPVIGNIMDGAEFINDPSLENAGWFFGGLAADIFTGGAGRAALKGVKLARRAAKAAEALKVKRLEAALRIGNQSSSTSMKAYRKAKAVESKANKDMLNGIGKFVGYQSADVLQNYIQQNTKAFGGTLSSNGADWSNGLTWINNGGTHEENPYEGVPMGIDSEGKPNLVEEGEVVFDDYVFSARLTVPKTMRDKYKLKEDITFADAAKKLSKESEERPNDPISKRGLKSFMEELESYQEEIRMKKQATEVKKKISKMSPEELQGLSQLMQGQNMQMEQQMPEQLSAEQMAQQELAQQGNAPKFAKGGKKTKYKRDWFESRAKALEFELGDNFVYNDQDDEANLSNFNALYKAAQRQKAYDTYLKGQRKNWENTELASGRYKRSDDGKSIYSAKFYGDDDLGKDYIGSDGTRISAEDYNTQLNKYNTLKAKNKLTNEEKASIAAYEKASYKKSPVIKGQFAKDYSGNTIYNYDTDVTSTWIPTDDKLVSDFKWDSKDAASILFDPEKNNSTLSELRYAPVLGGAIGLITDLASSPDYSRAEDIKRAGNISVPHVSFNPIGNYLTYKPFDINYVANQLRASEQAGMRNILNTSGGNSGTAMAGILANGYNSQLALGNAYRQAMESNRAQEQRVEEFNRGTNTTNSQGFLEAARANQAADMQAGRMGYEATLAGNTLMDQIDARRSASTSANMTNLVNSLGQIGEEAYDKDRLDALIARGVLKDLYNNGRKANGGMLTRPRKNNKRRK